MSIKIYSMKKDKDLKLSNNFSVKEFACNDGSDKVIIDSDLVNVLQSVRDHFGKPVIITSAYRTESYNIKVGGSSSSQHCKGTAADIYISGVDPLKIALYVSSIGNYSNKGGIGLYSRPEGITHGFVHVDVRSTYSRWISKSGTSYLSVSKIMPTISYGDRDGNTGVSYSVTVLQRHLGITADGIFGKNTKTTLLNWQKEHGLSVDGIAGSKTWGSF